jgi:trimethylamine--corrinoid protein Co-methyltransferase
VSRQIDFSDAALGLDVVHDVGPGGSFIDQMHTAERFRDELWFPRLLDREYFGAWLAAGGRDVEDRSREVKREILASHTPEPIDADLDGEISRIVAGAKKELAQSAAAAVS